jgi:hypothetical protein
MLPCPPFPDFVSYLAAPPTERSIIDRLLTHACGLHGSDVLSDDFSTVESDFP